MPQPPYPGPPPVPQGELVLHLSVPGLFGESLTTPVLGIDGFQHPARWGTFSYLVPAGHRFVDVRAKQLYEYGGNSLWVTVHPGQQTHVYYAASQISLKKGNIGTTPQKSPGRWLPLIAVLVALPVGVLVAGLAAMLG